jgi:hypothetical protein
MLMPADERVPRVGVVNEAHVGCPPCGWIHATCSIAKLPITPPSIFWKLRYNANGDRALSRYCPAAKAGCCNGHNA